jgi:hypothetical protein
MPRPATLEAHQQLVKDRHIMQNITTLNAKVFERFIKPMDYVTNGSDVGRYFGTTKRGVHVVAWGDKRNDYDTANKLTQYLARHSGE